MNVVYIGTFNGNGVSSLLNLGENSENIKETYTNTYINEINSYFPERSKLHVKHPEWVADNTLNILDTTTIKASFIDEGAGYRNTFGYYIYDTVSPPSSVYDISTVYIMFPNASANGKGGSLVAGDSMLLPYSVTTSTSNNLLIGTPSDYNFPAGKSVGFVIFANAWKGSYINKNAPRYFTDSRLNPERADWLKYHTALVKTSADELVMGIEDLPRERNYCDHDFNDLLVIIKTDLSAISPGNFSDPNETLPETAPIEYEMGYKKVFVEVEEDSKTKIAEAICTLRIPYTSTIVRHKLSNKLRTNSVFVHSVIGSRKKIYGDKYALNDYTGKEYNSGTSSADKTFVYAKNTWANSNLNTDQDINSEGIHFFRNKEEAIDYKFDY